MANVKVLLCEDDENLGMLLREYLQAKEYDVDLMPDGEEGAKAFAENRYDLCILDVMMPQKDGFTLAQEIRHLNSRVPIIFLTAKTLKEDVLAGFKIGADDYMTKPFNILEVKARIKAILRRAGTAVQTGDERRVVRVRDLEVNCQSRTVMLGGQPVRLTAKEFDLLQLLITHRGKVYSREALLETVWKYDYMGDMRTVDVHIRRLREKIERDNAGPEFILTKWGVGYYFTDKD